MPDSVDSALKAWGSGSPVIGTVEDGGRRRGDLMLAAEFADARRVNEVLLNARGLLSLAVDEGIYAQLGLNSRRGRLSPNPGAPRAMTTIEATSGVTTGISAGDRALTIAAAVAVDAEPGHVREPGHVPVLLAAQGGVRERALPVEAAVELSRLAGLRAAGLLSEVLDPDGELADLAELERVGARIGAPLLAVDELAAHCQRMAAR